MSGPPRKPTSLKLLQGTDRADRVAPDEPMPEIAIPDPPVHLSGEALAEWGRITVELHDLGLLTRLDSAALAAYCQCRANWIEAEVRFSSDPENLKVNSVIVCRFLELMHKYLTEFGMTPASRTRISAKPRDSKPKSAWSVGKKEA